jgi:hypothetical protein
MKKYELYIGIDTGTETGFAEWSRPLRKLTIVDSLMIHQAMTRITALQADKPRQFFVRVEDARLRTWIPKMPTASRERGRREGAGSVKRDAKILEDFLTDLGVDFELVAPKNNKTKVTQDYFSSLTGWKGKTNQHARDAAMMVFGF